MPHLLSTAHRMMATGTCLTISILLTAFTASAEPPDIPWLGGGHSGGISDAAPLRTNSNAHRDWIMSQKYSPDGQFLASCGHDNKVKICRKSNGSLVTTLTSHSNWVLKEIFSPDGQTLASCSTAG
jgi:WD40 repeat protein